MSMQLYDGKEINFDSRKMYLKHETKPFKVGIFGSRCLNGFKIESIIVEKLLELNCTKIITCQEPGGVSREAQRVSKKYGYPLQLHFLNMRYLRGAFYMRSVEIIEESDYFIIIHDGKSKGTSNELELVKKSNKPYHYEIITPEELEIAKAPIDNSFNVWEVEDEQVEF